FVCLEDSHTLKDAAGEPLDHLRCDFVFSAVLPCFKDRDNVFTLREANYLEHEGIINIALVNEAGLRIVSTVEPDAALRNRPASEGLPGDDARLRLVEARITLPAQPATQVAASPAIPAGSLARDEHSSGLLRLFLESEY